MGKKGKLNRITSLRYIFSVLLVFAFVSSSFASQVSTIGHKLEALEKIKGKFTFAVVGDNRSGDDTYKRIIGVIMGRKPDFIVNVGDLITIPGSLSGWKRFWELSAPITVPYFFTVGNHDVGNRKSEEIYREQVDLPGNELYYSFVCGNSLFIVLDSSVIGQERKITGKQFDWLESLLETTEKRHRFVFVHHPLYVDMLSLTRSLAGHPGERNRLRDLLVRHKVGAVFTGHLHLYEKKSVSGLTQIITGGGGAPLLTDETSGGFFHFILVTVDGDTVTGKVIDLDGNVREEFDLNTAVSPETSR
ncbi:MAG TPA: metallophosphoesterase [Thermodesulfovibrionales bacterium]|nr:metallophosphoesterase [Thermodesulfovibrionales bacterium]